MTSFKHWTAQQVEDTFGIRRVSHCPLLVKWLAMPYSPNEEERADLVALREKLSVYADAWNEEELKFKFIVPIVNLVDYEGNGYNAFANRRLSFKHNDTTIGGSVDFMVASGRYEPKAPYFCFHEYKKEKGPADTDPRGQLLIAMLAAQSNNHNDKPIYGCYVIGRMWFFTVLEKDTCCFSSSYSADNEAIFDIFAALKGVKVIIRDELM